MAAENLKSTAITNLDTLPPLANTRGAGAAAYLYTLDDYITPTTTGLAATTSTYEMCRFPVEAKIKSVKLAASEALDTNSSPTLVFDINVAFSDSTVDGTPATLQAGIPTTANTGAVTTVSSYSSPNKLFGSTTAAQAKTGLVLTKVEYTFNGVGANYAISFPQTELWSLFGFTNPYGVALDPGGFFNLLLYISTAAATAQAGTIYSEVQFVV